MPNEYAQQPGQDDVFEALLRQAAREVSEQENELLWQKYDNGEEFQPSPEFQRRFIKTQNGLFKPAKRRFRLRAVLASAIVVTLVFSVLMMSVSAFRDGVYNFFVQPESEGTILIPSDIYSNYEQVLIDTGKSWDKIFVPNDKMFSQMIPEIQAQDTFIAYKYQDGEKFLQLSQLNYDDSRTGFDNEHGSVEITYIGEYAGFRRSDERDISLAWKQDGYTFLIYSNYVEEQEQLVYNFAEQLVAIYK